MGNIKNWKVCNERFLSDHMTIKYGLKPEENKLEQIQQLSAGTPYSISQGNKWLESKAAKGLSLGMKKAYEANRREVIDQGKDRGSKSSVRRLRKTVMPKL